MEIMARMTTLMKEVYGKTRFIQSNQPYWELLAERCSFPKMPEQGDNECGFYVLKVAELYDGIKLVHEIYKRDSRSVDWKAEFLFYVLLHPNNEIPYDQWPKELAECVKLLQMGSQGSEAS